MNLSVIKTAVTSKVGLQVLAAKQHSPAILFGAGVVGVVGTAVLASRATLKLNDVISEFEEDAQKIVEVRTNHSDKYTDAQAKSDGIIIRTKLVKNIVKLYSPAIGLGCLSVAALTGSHIILSRRNASLVAAYTAVDKAFKQYRGRVINEMGADKDKEFMFGTSEREVYSQKKNGEPVVETIRTFGDGRSPYAVIFDESNQNFNREPSYNAVFLRHNQNYLNDRLRAKGHLFLNEVYRELGFPDTTAGAVTGWIYNSQDGDGFVDFGIWEDRSLEGFHDFMQGKNGSLMLDFNVDGTIFRDIEKKD